MQRGQGRLKCESSLNRSNTVNLSKYTVSLDQGCGCNEAAASMLGAFRVGYVLGLTSISCLAYAVLACARVALGACKLRERPNEDSAADSTRSGRSQQSLPQLEDALQLQPQDISLNS